MWQPKIFLFQFRQMRSLDNRAGVTAPFMNVQTGVVFGDHLIARDAENRFDKIHVCNLSLIHI